MTKPNWTPGPWRVEQIAYSTSIKADHDQTIAEVYLRTPASANARLIAAAPEMAQALLNTAFDAGRAADALELGHIDGVVDGLRAVENNACAILAKIGGGKDA